MQENSRKRKVYIKHYNNTENGSDFFELNNRMDE